MGAERMSRGALPAIERTPCSLPIREPVRRLRTEVPILAFPQCAYSACQRFLTAT